MTDPTPTSSPTAAAEFNNDITAKPCSEIENPFAAPSLEGWPPVNSYVAVPTQYVGQDKDVVMTDAIQDDIVLTDDDISDPATVNKDRRMKMIKEPLSERSEIAEETSNTLATKIPTNTITITIKAPPTAANTTGISNSENLSTDQSQAQSLEILPATELTPSVPALDSKTNSTILSRTTTIDQANNESTINNRASSQNMDTSSNSSTQIPSREVVQHGSPTRRFLNENVTGVLLEGLKLIVKDRPSNPLRALGEYLIHRSQETPNV